MKQNEKIGKFYVLIAVALLVTSVAVAVAVAGPLPYPGTGPTPTPGPTPGAGPGGPAPYPTPAPPAPPAPPTPPTPPGALPDLNVTHKWETFANGEFTVHFTVKNIGNAEAGESTACKYIGGIEEATVIIPALGANTSCTRAFAAEPCPPGTTITVTVCADNYDVVAESDETNNCMTNTFTCLAGPLPGGPDLVVEKTVEQRLRPGDPDRCQYKVDYTVKNIGNGLAGTNTVAKIVDGIVVVAPVIGNCPQLGVNTGFTGMFDWANCTCGTPITVTVCADYYNVVTESNESNNCEINVVECRKADINVTKQVRNATALGDFAKEINANSSDVVEFNCTVHNNGSYNLTLITVTDKLSASLEYIDATPTPTIVSISGGETTLTWSVAGPLKPCNWLNYTIYARVVGCGVDTNTQTATAAAWLGKTVTDSDTATVNVAERAGIKVGKTYLNGNFTLLVINNGSCCNLTNVEVWETMTNLTYVKMIPAGSDPPLVSHGAGNVTRLQWTIPLLTTGTTKTFMVNATAEGPGPYANELYARGTAVCTGAFIADDIEIVPIP